MHEALQRLEQEIAQARHDGITLIKLIHGYGSTGAGGDIRIAVQARLREMAKDGAIRWCVFGEEWAKSCEEVWRLLQERPELKSDADLGRRNLGITVVLL